MEQYYVELEMLPSLDFSVIRKSYLKCCLKYHPDKNHGSLESIEKMKRIVNAYNFLKEESDPETKPAPPEPKAYAHPYPYPGFNFDDYLKKIYDELREIYLREQYLINQSILRAESGNEYEQNKCDLCGHKYNKTFIMLPKKKSMITINCKAPYIRDGEYHLP